MPFIKKYKLELLFALGITVLYFLLRLPTLTSIPIFTDEAIYIRWAQIANNDANWRFISLTDGKQPLFIWLMMIVMRFIEDPLAAGRLTSVLAGLVTMIGLFFLSIELFKNRWIGLASALLYVLYPFAIVYDRLAIYDSLVGTFFIWGLYFSIRLVRKPILESALLLGLVAGFATLNKSSGFFTVYLLPFFVGLYSVKEKAFFPKVIRFAALSFVVVVMTYGIYTILRLSPFFYIIEEKNALFVYPLKEWLLHPFLTVWSNTTALYDWFLRYFGVTFFLAVLLAFFKKELWKEKILLILYFLLPLGALAVFGKLIYPRYIFFMTLPLLPLVAYSLISYGVVMKSYLKKLLFITFILSYSVVTTFFILTDITRSSIPRSDKGQLVLDWPSGIGIEESLRYFKDVAAKENIAIFTAGTFGLLPYAYEIYMVDNKNISLKGFWPVSAEVPEEIRDSSEKVRTFVVFYQECPSCQGKGLAPLQWPLKKVLQIERPLPDSFFTVYEVTR